MSLEIRADEECDRTVAFIAKTVNEAHSHGVIVGLSGGIDSAVVGALCARALGKEKVLGLLMPSTHTPREDLRDARRLADSWGIRREEIPISGIADGVMAATKAHGTKMAKANVEARVRMVLNYYRANSLGYLVAGTGDRSELLLGYFSKWGDGGADFLPIAHLYKTQVRNLGAYLGLPKRVVEKPASPQLWPGQKATDEIPADYGRLDVALHCLFDLKQKPAKAAAAAHLPLGVVKRVLVMHTKTEHKRRLPPSLT
ncbi:MAG TPA: NAD+ synthase [Nitrososphaerales archaeon]|nr:NAD+ synthase [Nitrososphaerales archaeon]